MTATSSWYFPNGSLSAPNQPLALDDQFGKYQLDVAAMIYEPDT